MNHFFVVEVQRINGAPVVTQQAITDPTNLNECKAKALTLAAYWTDPPVGVTPPPVVTIMLCNEQGRVVPGYLWTFAFEPPAVEVEQPEETPAEGNE